MIKLRKTQTTQSKSVTRCCQTTKNYKKKARVVTAARIFQRAEGYAVLLSDAAIDRVMEIVPAVSLSLWLSSIHPQTLLLPILTLKPPTARTKSPLAILGDRWWPQAAIQEGDKNSECAPPPPAQTLLKKHQATTCCSYKLLVYYNCGAHISTRSRLRYYCPKLLSVVSRKESPPSRSLSGSAR